MSAASPAVPVADVEPWPEAEQLFRRDARWLGGDDAYSIPLGDGRHLWLFGDTFVGDGTDRSRAGAAFVNNTIGLQHGSDPASAVVRFAWGTSADGRPTSFLADRDPTVHLWPQHGSLIGDRLLLFVMRVRHRDPARHPDPSLPESLRSFEVVGWGATSITGLAAAPRRWRQEPLEVPATPGVALVGAGVVRAGGHLYAHALAGTPARGRGVLVARWRLEDLAVGDLSRPEWFAGRPRGWSADVRAAVSCGLRPVTEFTVHRDRTTGRFLAVQLAGGRGGPRIELRAAERPEGPWSGPRLLHRPSLGGDAEAIVYAGKAHPALAAEGGLLVTYASNGTDLDTVLRRDDLYYPHALRVTLHR